MIVWIISKCLHHLKYEYVRRKYRQEWKLSYKWWGSPIMDWWPVQGVPLFAPCDSWDGWMDGWMNYCREYQIHHLCFLPHPHCTPPVGPCDSFRLSLAGSHRLRPVHWTVVSQAPVTLICVEFPPTGTGQNTLDRLCAVVGLGRLGVTHACNKEQDKWQKMDGCILQGLIIQTTVYSIKTSYFK